MTSRIFGHSSPIPKVIVAIITHWVPFSQQNDCRILSFCFGSVQLVYISTNRYLTKSGAPDGYVELTFSCDLKVWYISVHSVNLLQNIIVLRYSTATYPKLLHIDFTIDSMLSLALTE